MVEDSLLEYLGHIYFHQDYDLEADTPIDNVRMFANEEQLGVVEAFYCELAELLAFDLSEEEAHTMWMTDAKSSYDPLKDGISYLNWLREILLAVGAVLRERWSLRKSVES